MADASNDTMTAEQYRNKYGDDGLTAARDYDSAIAIDPGTTTGVAIYWSGESVDTLRTETTTFWGLLGKISDGDIITCFPGQVFIVEAPYLTKWGKAQDNSAMAYNSGQVAREAELLVGGLRRKGLDVIEHDPHSSGNSSWGGGKWDSKTAHSIVGDWEGPDNAHVRDSIRMLVIYGFIG